MHNFITRGVVRPGQDFICCSEIKMLDFIQLLVDLVLEEAIHALRKEERFNLAHQRWELRWECYNFKFRIKFCDLQHQQSVWRNFGLLRQTGSKGKSSFIEVCTRNPSRTLM